MVNYQCMYLYIVTVDLVQVRTNDGPVTNMTLIFDPVLFDHKGVYTCMAEYNITVTGDTDSLSETHVLLVDCKFILIKLI